MRFVGCLQVFLVPSIALGCLSIWLPVSYCRGDAWAAAMLNNASLLAKSLLAHRQSAKYDEHVLLFPSDRSTVDATFWCAGIKPHQRLVCRRLWLDLDFVALLEVLLICFLHRNFSFHSSLFAAAVLHRNLKVKEDFSEVLLDLPYLIFLFF